MRIGTCFCENSVDPIGIDAACPRFSWQFLSDARNVRQTAYQILVADSYEAIRNKCGNLWDSGVVSSAQNTFLPYGGAPLKSATKYYWRVRAWSSADDTAIYSKVRTFETGLLAPEDWEGHWIEGHGKSGELFRREFTLDQAARDARIYISGLGFYRLYLNGEEIGNAALDPGCTDFAKKALYSTYDVTKYLRPGQNVLGVVLGNGLFSRSEADIGRNKGCAPITARFREAPILLLQCSVRMADGTSMTVCSGEDWRVGNGPLVYNDYYNGEIYDARLEQRGWAAPGFDDAGWLRARAVDYPKDILVSQTTLPQITRRAALRVRKTYPAGPHRTIYDFGQNFSGRVRLEATGKPGSRITIRHSELMNSDGTLSFLLNGVVQAEDVYIFGETGTICYEPGFTYHGFRYAQIDIEGEAEITNLSAYFINSSVARTGRFECSDKLINQIHRNVIWGQLSNLMSIPTDCPQKDERFGWLGAAHLLAEETIYNFDMYQFLRKYLDDMRASQNADGSLWDLAPVYWKLGPADPHYGAACVLIPWYLYLYYGDRRVLEENYGMMTRWLAWLAQFEDKGLMTLERFADWCPPLNVCSMDNTPVFFVSTWFYYYALSVTAKIAGVLGERDAKRTYAAHASRVRAAFIRAFVREDGVAVGLYEEYMAKIRKAKAVGPEIAASIEGTLKDMCSSRSQTPFALALVLQLLPEDKIDTVTRQLLRSVIEINSYHLNTGSLGTKYLFEALSQTGHSDVACKVLTQTSYPSYGYMLREGATTIWERWEQLENVSMNSHNHSQMCDFDSWLYRSLAGIRADEAQPGFRHIVLAPEIVKDLRYVRAEVDTVQGTVKSGWALSETGLEVKVSIPANCTAELRLPAAFFARPSLLLDGQLLLRNGAVSIDGTPLHSLRVKDGCISIHIGSGSYSFSLRAE